MASRRRVTALAAGACIAACFAFAAAAGSASAGGRHAGNFLLAAVSRLIADPQPVADAVQREELAHILKTVRAWRVAVACQRAPGARGRNAGCALRPLQAFGRGAGSRQRSWVRGARRCLATTGAHPRHESSTHPPSLADACRCSGRTAWRYGCCRARRWRSCRSSSSLGLLTASSATWSTSSPAASGRSGCTSVRGCACAGRGRA